MSSCFVVENTERLQLKCRQDYGFKIIVCLQETVSRGWKMDEQSEELDREIQSLNQWNTQGPFHNRFSG